MSIVPRISHGILTLYIYTKEDLVKSYMPFVSYGGLFVPTSRAYQLGEEVFVLVSFEEESEKLPVTGKVIWITPKDAQGGRIPGIGIQLTQEDAPLVTKIETQLAGLLNGERRTNTF